MNKLSNFLSHFLGNQTVPIHCPNLDFGSAPSTASSSKRDSTSAQPSAPTFFLFMNFKPFRARAAPDLFRSILFWNLLEDVMRFSSWETCRSLKESWDPSEDEFGRFSSWFARNADSESPPLMLWTRTESSRTSRVISTYSSSLNLAFFLLLVLVLFVVVTNGPLNWPLYAIPDVLSMLSVSDNESYFVWFSWCWISIVLVCFFCALCDGIIVYGRI